MRCIGSTVHSAAEDLPVPAAELLVHSISSETRARNISMPAAVGQQSNSVLAWMAQQWTSSSHQKTKDQENPVTNWARTDRVVFASRCLAPAQFCVWRACRWPPRGCIPWRTQTATVKHYFSHDAAPVKHCFSGTLSAFELEQFRKDGKVLRLPARSHRMSHRVCRFVVYVES